MLSTYRCHASSTSQRPKAKEAKELGEPATDIRWVKKLVLLTLSLEKGYIILKLARMTPLKLFRGSSQ